MASKTSETRKSRQGDASGTLPAPPKRALSDRPKHLTSIGKLAVFLIFPFCVGMFGLFSSYLQQRSEPDRKMRFERDFALPFTMTLLLITILGLQTRGYTTKPQPLMKWPKVRKEKKIRHLHVVKGQNPNGVVAAEDKEGAKKIAVSGKKD